MPINCLINSEQIVNNSCSKNQFMVNSWINSWTLMFQKTVLSPFVLRPPSLPLFDSLTLRLFDSSTLCLLVSYSLPLFVFSATQFFRCPIKKKRLDEQVSFFWCDVMCLCRRSSFKTCDGKTLQGCSINYGIKEHSKKYLRFHPNL